MAVEKPQEDSFALPGYEAGPGVCGVLHSVRKLEIAATNLAPHLPGDVSIESRPSEKEEDSWAYRCRCTFQLVKDGTGRFHYAMRHEKQPVQLGTSEFPIATFRIQDAMRRLLKDILNSDGDLYPTLRLNLTSATFSSAWKDSAESDCIVTLYYDHPLDKENWRKGAESACDRLGLRQLNGRSKKSLICAVEHDEQAIRDTVYIRKCAGEIGWDVSLSRSIAEVASVFEVHYEKPESAFYHPNAYAMKKALKWMLDRLSWIVEECHSPCRLLEMYCGCGAHTVALAKSGLLQEIISVELDNRLVEACLKNIQINKLEQVIKVRQGDAGKWAKRFDKDSSMGYEILLVDPPRSGLDEQVCQMAQRGPCQHFLYISCGHRALLRDLERLSADFQVVNCSQLDLFPRTDSIETLVHLQRIRKETLV
jgi:tRNA/tmRNA/rRNA uracil-C5-methylase (TrmA/RlmC/RlmD family)